MAYTKFDQLQIGGAGYVPGSGLNGLAMGRAFPFNEWSSNGHDCKVIYVDSAVDTSHLDYRNGEGDSWRNAFSTIQAGVNEARYNYGTSTINYDDDRHVYVLVAPGNYAERVAFSAKNVHLIGLGIPGGDNGVTLNPTTPSTFAFAFSGNGCELANFWITENTAVYGMYLPPAESCRIHDIAIEGAGTMTYGIYGGDSGLKGTSIYNCSISGVTTAGIYYPTAANAYAIHGGIYHNIIGHSVTKGIDIDILTCYSYMIWQNWINGTSSASIECASTGILVADNWCDRAPSGTLTARDNHYSSAGA